MRKMNETELKVVLLVTRKTLGWFDPMTHERKEQDYISQSQFMEFTGKKSAAIAYAIQSCVERGWIIARDRQGNLCDAPEKRTRRKIWYQLGDIFTNKISSSESEQDVNLVRISTLSGSESESNLVRKANSTKEKKETNTKYCEQAREWNFQDTFKSMLESNQRHIHIIALYWKHKQYNPSNKEQYEGLLKRELRAAKNLTGFDDDALLKVMNYLNHQSFIGKWTLETVLKYINEDLKEEWLVEETPQYKDLTNYGKD